MKKIHQGSAAIDWEPHRRSFWLLFFLLQLQHYLFRISIPFIFHPHLSPLFLTLFFHPFWISQLPPSSLYFTVSFLTPKCESLSIFRCSSLPLISLPLSHLLFFLRRRTDLQKRSEIHQCCIVVAFWSAWWVTTQPGALMYKSVFINTLSICKSLSCCCTAGCGDISS